MIRHLVRGVLIGAFVGILGAHGVASASSLHVDGGVLQHWELQVDLPSDLRGSSEPTTDPAEPMPSDPPEPTTDPSEPMPSDAPEPTTDPAEPVPSDPPEQPEPTTDPSSDSPTDEPEPTTEASGETP